MDVASVAIALMEAFNKWDLGAVGRLCSPDVPYIEKGTNRHRQGHRRHPRSGPRLEGGLLRHPRHHLQPAASAGSTGVLEITWTGTNDGPLELPSGATVPATGKSVEFDDCQIYEVEDGKLVQTSGTTATSSPC